MRLFGLKKGYADSGHPPDARMYRGLDIRVLRMAEQPRAGNGQKKGKEIERYAKKASGDSDGAYRGRPPHARPRWASGAATNPSAR